MRPDPFSPSLPPSLPELTGATEGLLAIKSPWPSTIRSIHGDHERMEQTYFSFEGYYLTGDNARYGEEGKRDVFA